MNVLRWPVLLFLMVLSLGAIYRLAGDRPRTAWLGVITPGAFVGALIWLVASAGFALYAANLASYSKTYGTLASIVVVLLWLFLSALAVLVGAEVDGTEQQSVAPAPASQRRDGDEIAATRPQRWEPVRA